ncbi:uncharacterized protein HMPREF1541_04558 [Cyphellophora europaea CBS 101466]|uniref:Azaphilone pigments biosynthesis cluster protein L N-terminal domain-containing protein n=1 Tax=Cyphellophora europaea (strain CBS 101466) TaxID=1220924 RepID=W2RV15_CYPE1|nr:uncharacterized protein HMPREF1541_04558 [Cyphellophora europaea CBS 101466]ETN40282.1 hypothetical protein HMPREF1541_04558 [Cyphellophora europaea CBS 101466]
MTEPLSITASLLAVTTAALQSSKSLYNTVKRFKGRDKTLRRLQGELEDLTNILASLTQVMTAEQSISTLLRGPVERCDQVCREFQQAMETFGGKPKTGVLDWAKMEFMRGGIQDFIDSLASYKSTISVGIYMSHTSKISDQVLQEYNEIVQDTAYDLELHLRRIEEKMTQINVHIAPASSVDVDLKDEREVTQQCLRICEDAKSYIKSIMDRESTLLPQPSHDGDEDQPFEARTRTRDALNGNQDKFAETIDYLRTRLDVLLQQGDVGNDAERSRLQADIDLSKQCLDVCKVASEVSRQTVYRIGEVIAEGDSDQVVVNTLADLFDIKKAFAKDNAAQLVGSMTAESLRDLADKRYGSRSAILHSGRVDDSIASSPAIHEVRTSRHTTTTRTDNSEQSPGLRSKQLRPTANEIKKRQTDDVTDSGRQ